jgi:hypothetical protein
MSTKMMQETSVQVGVEQSRWWWRWGHLPRIFKLISKAAEMPILRWTMGLQLGVVQQKEGQRVLNHELI